MPPMEPNFVTAFGVEGFTQLVMSYRNDKNFTLFPDHPNPLEQARTMIRERNEQAKKWPNALGYPNPHGRKARFPLLLSFLTFSLPPDAFFLLISP